MSAASGCGRGAAPLALLTLSCAAAILSWPAAAQAPQAPLTVYSNVCFNKSSGDTHGSLFILLSRAGEWDVVYQQAESWPRRPVLGSATLKDRQFQFGVTLESGTKLTFNGTITPEEVVGSFAGAKVEHWKKRPADHSWADDGCGK